MVALRLKILKKSILKILKLFFQLILLTFNFKLLNYSKLYTLNSQLKKISPLRFASVEMTREVLSSFFWLLASDFFNMQHMPHFLVFRV